MKNGTLPWIICAILAGFLIFVGWRSQQAAAECNVTAKAMDRAIQVGLVVVKPQTRDTLFMNTKLKYVLTGESRLYGDN